jgi:D-arabinose 1-dehydrogenase-like Zn-dependent alcohol dehydrogenase
VPEIERFDFNHALDAYHRLEDGAMTARAVIVPNAI